MGVEGREEGSEILERQTVSGGGRVMCKGGRKRWDGKGVGGSSGGDLYTRWPFADSE